MSKKWEILNKSQIPNPKSQVKKLIKILLENRGLKIKEEQDAFFASDLSSVTPQHVGIDTKQLTKAIKRIQQAIEKKEKIIVFGDYDVDGICGTAILWETLHGLGADVMPYIPSRIEEGYGLSIKGIENVILNLFQDLAGIPDQVRDDKRGLIITVDNGIVAHEAVGFANKQGIDVIVTDHHMCSEKLPNAQAIVHTTNLCGTSVAYLLSQTISNKYQIQNIKYKIPGDHLALVALATVADLVPLTGANRILLKHGLDVLHTTTRPGIVALCNQAAIMQEKIGVYEIGHILAPRLNAMGRIASAMDSLRLLCTKDRLKAKVFAEKLGETNRVRQELTKSLSQHAVSSIINRQSSIENLLFIAHEDYEEGVIGLIAGKLVEVFYRPAIVLSIGKQVSKASARSIAGFNIIEFIRSGSHLLMNAGGHPMAAGFTVATEKIKDLENHFSLHAKEMLPEELLQRVLKIDCELPLQYVSQEAYEQLQQLAPFGMGNPEPVFVSDAKILSLRAVGKEKNHLQLTLSNFPAIGFGMGERISEFSVGDTVQVVYTIEENEWNNKKSLQLKIKDIKNIKK